MRHSWRIAAAVVAVCLVFASAATAQDPVNMIENPGFEDGVLLPWNKYGADATTTIVGRPDVHTGRHALKIDVAGPGENFWSAGLQYKPVGVVFEEGVLYTWAFFAKSDPPVEINIKPELAQDPWTAYGAKRAFLVEEYQEYWTEWTAPIDVNPASLTLHIQFDQSTIWIDDARWYEGAYVPFDGEPQSVDPSGKAAAVWASLKAR